MDKKIFEKIILDFQEKGIENFKKRDIDIPINTNKIITLIGPRRAGKTFLFYQIMTKLSTNIENIVYINFEDERLSIKKEDLNSILETYLEIYPDKDLKEIIFFFDEIQNVQGWEQFVRRIYDSISKNIYITGSSAKLLSKEISTSLRGRTLTYEIYPLSFKEFLNFKNIKIENKLSTLNSAKIKSEYKKYIQIGGFPEIINYDETLRLKTLQNYSEVMLYKDIVERYKLKDITKIKYFIKKTISNISKEFSINKTYNEFKSQNINISKDLLYEYPTYIEDAFYIFFINKYSKSLIKQEFSSKKPYIIDLNLANATSFKFSEDYGRILENLVFIELKRRGHEIYYHKQKKECDFVILDRMQITQAIQVTKSLEDPNTKKREIEGLLDACKTYKLKEGLILTDDEEQTFTQDNIKITVKPIWKWLLE